MTFQEQYVIRSTHYHDTQPDTQPKTVPSYMEN